MEKVLKPSTGDQRPVQVAARDWAITTVLLSPFTD